MPSLRSVVGSEDRDPLRVETAAAAQPFNCLLSLFGRAIAILKSHQRAPAIDTQMRDP